MVINDGGRAAAGFRGAASDCVCRAISIATGQSYEHVYEQLNFLATLERPGSKRRGGKRSSARTGVFKATIKRYFDGIGWEWHPTMHIGQGCKVHVCREDLPGAGRYVLSLSRHLAAWIDGELHDTFDCSRDGTRCVYGFWCAPGTLQEDYKPRLNYLLGRD